MATQLSQKQNLLSVARQAVRNSTNNAQLRRACLDLVDAVVELKQDLRIANNRIRNIERERRKRRR